jgi:hypothetical protein
MENKTKIIITRSSEWMNRLRSYTIFIDGMPAGFVKNGSSEEFIVTPGVHKLQAKLGFFYSKEFSANVGVDQIVYLKTKSALRFYWPLYILLLAGVLLNLLNKNADKTVWIAPVEWICISPFILYFLYYLTAGRKKYLLLDDDKDNIFSK